MNASTDTTVCGGTVVAVCSSIKFSVYGLNVCVNHMCHAFTVRIEACIHIGKKISPSGLLECCTMQIWAAGGCGFSVPLLLVSSPPVTQMITICALGICWKALT